MMPLRVFTILFFVSLCFGCEPQAGPKAIGYCLDSPLAKDKAEEIRDYIIEEANRLGFDYADQTDPFRDLEDNKSLVFIQLRSATGDPAYQIEAVINPTWGSSSLTVYGPPDGATDAEIILLGLKSEFEFSWVDEEDGICPDMPAQLSK